MEEYEPWAQESLIAKVDLTDDGPLVELDVEAEKENTEQKKPSDAVGKYTVLCLSYEKKRLAAACYEEHNHVVHYLRDTPDEDDFNTMRCLIDRMRPTHVIANSSNNRAFRTALQLMVKCKVDDNLSISHYKSNSGGQQENGSGINNPHGSNTSKEAGEREENVLDVPVFTPNTSGDAQPEPSAQTENPSTPTEEEDSAWFAPLKMLPRSCFSLQEGKKWLQGILDYDERDPELRLKLLFDCEDTNMICAIGALLRFVNQLRIGIDTEDVNVESPVESFRAIFLLVDEHTEADAWFRGDVLEVDRTTVRALEIFESDVQGQGKTRVVFGRRVKHRGSLFDFCNLCKSTPGKQKLRSWFARPVTSREILKNRLDGVSFFQQDCHARFTQFIRSKLRHVNALSGPLARMRLSKIPVQDWCNVLRTFQTLVDIGDGVRQYEVDLVVLGLETRALGHDLARLLAVLSETFDVEESAAEKRFVVRTGVSPDLDELKCLHDELGEYLTEVARSEIENYGFASCSVCYLPIIGYMVVVPIQEQLQRDIERVYTTHDSVGYKTSAMHGLDRRFGDIRSRITDREMLITNSLQELILSRRKIIFEAIEVTAVLDCLISLALVSRENDWVRPRFTADPLINIQKARHPIAEKCCPGPFVGNSIKSGVPAFGSTFSKVKLITGPNASGKSVYLKSVGVILYLAHVGSFVPATRAEIGPVNRVISRMYTIDLVLNGMSSFANDLKQMSDAIRKADGNSVIIIDEFGKGTMTEVGLSLLASCLNYWLENEARCPHVFVSTHFYSLRNLLHESVLVSNNLMKVLKDNDGELKFTYELVSGVCDYSYANYTARKMGIAEQVIKRADEVCQVLKEGKGLLEVTPKTMKEEVEMAELAIKMQDLYPDFASWNMDENSSDFLEKVKSTLFKL